MLFIRRPETTVLVGQSISIHVMLVRRNGGHVAIASGGRCSGVTHRGGRSHGYGLGHRGGVSTRSGSVRTRRTRTASATARTRKTMATACAQGQQSHTSEGRKETFHGNLESWSVHGRRNKRTASTETEMYQGQCSSRMTRQGGGTLDKSRKSHKTIRF